MNKQKRQIMFLFLLVVFGVIYVYIQYLLVPELGKIHNKTLLLKQKQAYLEKLKRSYLVMPELKKKAEELNGREEDLDGLVPKKLDKPYIMLDIYNLAKKNGVTPKSLSFEPLQEKENHYAMGMNFSCTGSKENIFELIDQLDKGGEYKYTLDSLSLNATEGIIDGNNNVNMRIVVYAYKE